MRKWPWARSDAIFAEGQVNVERGHAVLRSALAAAAGPAGGRGALASCSATDWTSGSLQRERGTPETAAGSPTRPVGNVVAPPCGTQRWSGPDRQPMFLQCHLSMSALIVLLPPQPASAPPNSTMRSRTTAAPSTATAARQAALLPLPGRAGAEVVAVVPAAMLSWHRVELPKGTTAASPRLRAVLEGLLEDQLLDEPETLHFALPPQVRPGAPLVGRGLRSRLAAQRRCRCWKQRSGRCRASCRSSRRRATPCCTRWATRSSRCWLPPAATA